MKHRLPGRSARRVAALVVVGLLAAGARPPRAGAQHHECLLRVQPRDGETGYHDRGQRCEGMYVGLQSAPVNVQVVSLVKGGLHYDLARDRLLYVRVPAITGLRDPVVLRGRGRESNLNWALDASLAPGGRLVWNLTDVIVREQLSSDRIGIFGQTVEHRAGFADTVFVPLAVGGSEAPEASRDSIELIVKIPGASGLRWALDPGGEQHPSERLNVDGYFRIVVPPGRAEQVALDLYWRPRGKLAFNQTPEQLGIYRW
jgi:hypothetical protein